MEKMSNADKSRVYKSFVLFLFVKFVPLFELYDFGPIFSSTMYYCFRPELLKFSLLTSRRIVSFDEPVSYARARRKEKAPFRHKAE